MLFLNKVGTGLFLSTILGATVLGPNPVINGMFIVGTILMMKNDKGIPSIK